MELPKETNVGEGSHGRWYGDACGTAFGLEVLGERWAMLIVRELLLGPLRFSDLKAALPGISAKVLTERLESLAQWGVLTRRQTPPPTPAQLYALTEWGYLAEPAIMELGRWAARSCLHNPHLPLSAVSLMTSMKTMQIPEALAAMPDMAIGMVVGREAFRVAIQGGALDIARGEGGAVDAMLRAPAATVIAGAIYADVPLDALEAEAGLVVEGDRAALARFLMLFALPPKL